MDASGRWELWDLSPFTMSRALPQALGYYGDSVAVGVTTGRRSLGSVERFGLSVGPPFVRAPPHWGTVRSGRSWLSSNEPTTTGARVSASFPRADWAPADWSSSSVALPVDSLADEPLGRRCSTSFAFCRHAIVPSALSGEGVWESFFFSTHKAVHYLPPSSRANLRWQNYSHITRRNEERHERGAF